VLSRLTRALARSEVKGLFFRGLNAFIWLYTGYLRRSIGAGVAPGHHMDMYLLGSAQGSPLFFFFVLRCSPSLFLWFFATPWLANGLLAFMSSFYLRASLMSPPGIGRQRCIRGVLIFFVGGSWRRARKAAGGQSRLSGRYTLETDVGRSSGMRYQSALSEFVHRAAYPQAGERDFGRRTA